ncbi:bifunctional adenosylcobinamide kinase/adenosylcobinamide-phosphate guanylyltransferase [Sulfurivirga sp.]|uniref:bifunctional adenosylcobinamide kinase/adenosylcobinamide-phosphate guanylyltransferase n=1 Tax=Sulfurivirga sp. TaxID=2614236 RepID=UPI00345BEF94
MHLVLGGARSGKSRYAMGLAESSALPVTFIATARALDEEMAARIQRHRQERPAHWETVEAPVDLAGALDVISPGRFVIVDCLTLWLLNCMEMDRMDALRAFERALEAHAGPVALVSNEVGMGVVPADRLSRRFVDELGWLHQRLAVRADRVTLMVAGLPLEVKG